MVAITIPVNIRLEGQQRILELVEVENILKEARLISLGACGCRKRVHGCDAPLDVCVGLDRKAEEQIKNGSGKRTGLNEALDALERSHAAGLVHIAYTLKESENIDFVCSCCSCCCHSMSALVRFGLPGAVTASRYVAITNTNTCINCGTCEYRCQFKARIMKNGELTYNKARCFGCGVCASTCPTKSIALVKRN